MQHPLCQSHGRRRLGQQHRGDGKLAAYLLDASASKYQISELTASYRAAAAFTCADYPDAGRLCRPVLQDEGRDHRLR